MRAQPVDAPSGIRLFLKVVFMTQRKRFGLFGGAEERRVVLLEGGTVVGLRQGASVHSLSGRVTVQVGAIQLPEHGIPPYHNPSKQ